jgi:type II secretory pathway pseudopilin PulG
MTDPRFFSHRRRASFSAGIAIGPILFIVAILGILAAAIAASSGSFTAGSNTEKNRSYAAALLQVGTNMKNGFDRVLGNGVDHAAVTINDSLTVNDTDLFSPHGGGVAVPSTSMAVVPSTDVWHFINGAVPKFGTTATERLAVIRVEEGICDQVNNKAGGLSTTPAPIDLGDFTNETTDLAGSASWPAALQGQSVGCVDNNNAISSGYWFYQVLGIR